MFGSEIKSFLQHPGFRTKLSTSHLLEYFTFQNIFTDGTLFRGVTLLAPGHTLTVRLDGSEPERRCYWDFNFAEPDDPASDEEYVEELDRLFRQAVERQLVSDVPVGAYLSGGMDSGSITAVAARTLPHLTTFTGGFDLTSASGIELAWDERSKAEAMSYVFKTEHYETVLKAGDMERCLPALMWHLEDPRVGQCLSELLRRAAREQVRQGRALRQRAATSSSPGTRGAITARSSTTTSSTTSRSTTASGTG